MKNDQVFKLIDGVFTPAEAGKVLTALINSKINRRNLEDFSNHIRFNNNLSRSKKRVVELTETKEKIKNLPEVAEANGVNLVVNSTIEISFKK
ncbi:hypothetical protein [Flavobacterium laiguense]|uniref:Uncharacterized protein n=1 Tax=Flavobacterium laiguense TaxID=2169409 RepID=A0A2U1JZ06_9FLAO|nr:hypothetical protein [Flavobacterium laiguense]PWA10451.1 hypothetical protein DB891_04250 [Flavobacterium laiguense]